MYLRYIDKKNVMQIDKICVIYNSKMNWHHKVIKIKKTFFLI